MRRKAILASVLAVAGTLALLPAAGGAQRGPVRFSLGGNVVGLYPGAKRQLAVNVRNPFRRKLRLVAVDTEVRRASRLCTAANLDIRPFRGALLIAPRRTRVVRLRVLMPETAAQECSAARFPLVFRARAVLR
jgi:hypothetical protein